MKNDWKFFLMQNIPENNVIKINNANYPQPKVHEGSIHQRENLKFMEVCLYGECLKYLVEIAF